MKTDPLAYYIALTLKTRQYGNCYVHAGMRSGYEHGEIRFYVSGYGRSLQGGGHKYKVHAYRNGKPVPSKELKTLKPET